MIQTLRDIDIELLVSAYYKLEKDIQWRMFPEVKSRQAGIQYKPGEDPWISATTSGKKWQDEPKINELNPFFKDTIFEELIAQYKLTRTRFMWLSPMSCYPMHVDVFPKLHIPIITNSQCYFVYKQGIVQNMAAGFVYKAETIEPHTFINCSQEARLHIMGNLENH